MQLPESCIESNSRRTVIPRVLGFFRLLWYIISGPTGKHFTKEVKVVMGGGYQDHAESRGSAV